jgi:hypothetical protein
MNSAEHAEITIRRAYADDEVALLRLAELDSAELPAGPLLIAELDGNIKVALSLRDGTSIADPFTRTVEVLELLRVHARVTVQPHGRRRPALRPRLIPQLR